MNDDTNEEVTEEELQALAHAQMVYLAEVMQQLTQSDRFNSFFKANYEIQQYINDDDQTVNIVLIERPPELAQQVLEGMLAEQVKEHTPAISVHSPDELDRLLNQKDKPKA